MNTAGIYQGMRRKTMKKCEEALPKICFTGQVFHIQSVIRFVLQYMLDIIKSENKSLNWCK